MGTLASGSNLEQWPVIKPDYKIMNELTLSTVWSDETMLKRVFSWLSRIGAGPKFGSRPIGWYQQHQCACIDILVELGADVVRCKAGTIQAWKNGRWVNMRSTDAIFHMADNKCRS